jgi:hypothetical protein
MQAIQREAEAMDVPECAAVLHERLLASIDPVVAGFLEFMSSGDTELVNLTLELGALHSHDFNTGHAAIMAGIDLTPVP